MIQAECIVSVSYSTCLYYYSYFIYMKFTPHIHFITRSLFRVSSNNPVYGRSLTHLPFSNLLSIPQRPTQLPFIPISFFTKNSTAYVPSITHSISHAPHFAVTTVSSLSLCQHSYTMHSNLEPHPSPAPGSPSTFASSPPAVAHSSPCSDHPHTACNHTARPPHHPPPPTTPDESRTA